MKSIFGVCVVSSVFVLVILLNVAVWEYSRPVPLDVVLAAEQPAVEKEPELYKSLVLLNGRLQADVITVGVPYVRECRMDSVTMDRALSRWYSSVAIASAMPMASVYQIRYNLRDGREITILTREPFSIQYERTE